MSKPILTAIIVIVSTTVSAGTSEDKTTAILKDVFAQQEQCDWKIDGEEIIEDDFDAIQAVVSRCAGRFQPSLIVLSGGTGFAVSDVTPEAVSSVLEKHAPGLVHGMLSASAAITPCKCFPSSYELNIDTNLVALMSRPVAGVLGKSIVITLPGSPKGAKETLESIIKLLPHACLQASGGDSRALHKGGVKKLEAEAGVSSSPFLSSSHVGGCGHDHGHRNGHHQGHARPVRHTKENDNPQSNDPFTGAARRHRSSPYPMLEVDDALALIKTEIPSTRVVTASVNTSLVGAVLAEDVTAKEAVPAFRASIVDGYAVVIPSDGSSTKGVFPVVSVSHASPGEAPPLQVGQIARITTGAPLPAGANSVLMVEDTRLVKSSEDGQEELEVEILASDVKVGENIREVGSDIEVGSTILRTGDQISATGGELGLLVSVGKAEVQIYHRPVVGVLSTGDEIVHHDRPGELRLGEVRDCNRPTIMGAIRGWGYEAVDLGIASDTPGALEETLRAAMRRVDVIITSGGVSMGELDLLKPTIERQLGGVIHFGRVSMKPGKPTTFATVPFKTNNGEDAKKAIFSLPGNPASAIVTLNLFVLPSLHIASGVEPAGLPRVPVHLSHGFKLDTQRNEYHRVVVTVGKDGLLWAASTGKQRSSMVGSMKGANALLCLPTGPGESLEKGDKCDALLMGAVRCG